MISSTFWRISLSRESLRRNTFQMISWNCTPCAFMQFCRSGTLMTVPRTTMSRMIRPPMVFSVTFATKPAFICLSAMLMYSAIGSRCEMSCRPASRVSAAEARTSGFLSLTTSHTMLNSVFLFAKMRAGVFCANWVRITAPAKRCDSERESPSNLSASGKQKFCRNSISLVDAIRPK